MIRISVTDEHAIPQLQSYLSRLGWLAVAPAPGAQLTHATDAERIGHPPLN